VFGLSLEKIFLVAVLAAVIIGPLRLPRYASRLAGVIRQLSMMMREAARRAEEDTGVAAIREDWRALDPRQYDPRRIIREAWSETDAGPSPTTVSPNDTSGAVVEGEREPQQGVSAPAMPAGQWVVQGSSGHPRRVWIAAEPILDTELRAATS